jgi:putative ABC transport system permease protein
MASDAGCIEVVGVAADARLGDLTGEVPLFVYLPNGQRPPMGPPNSVLHVRLEGDPTASIARIRQELAALAGADVRIEVQPIAGLIGPQLAPWRNSATLLSVFGGIGLVLATIGLYGVVSFLVARRTREIGIRLALGANRKNILSMVLQDTGKLVGTGAAVGLLASIATARVFSGLLYGVGSFDTAVVAATLTILALVGLGAAYGPARRASTVDPLVALRED